MKEKFKRFKNEKIVVNVRSQKQYDDFMKMCQEQGLKWSGGALPTKYNIYNKYKEETCINLNNLKELSYCDIDFYKNYGYKIITYKDFIKEGNMKYKVGDKVKVVDAGELYSAYEEFIKENAPQLLNKWERDRVLSDGGIYEVKATGKHLSCGRELAIIEQNNKVYIVDFKGLELVKQFTKSDLKDNHIVERRDGIKNLWKNENGKEYYSEDLLYLDYDLSDCDKYSIVRVYEFETLVWERKEKPVEILDDKEKEYLSYVIKPFKNEIIWIKKDAFHDNPDEEWIDIETNKDAMIFPNFKKGTMYKNMEVHKEYTLEELGLED